MTNFNKPLTNKRLENIRKQFLAHHDRILDMYDAGSFVEVKGTVGGDVVTYRYYNNGEVFER